MTRLALSLAIVLGCVATARALHHAGDHVGRVTVEDLTPAKAKLPDPRLPTLVTYESRESDPQNAPLKKRLAVIAQRPSNAGRARFCAVADTEKWNWWPVRRLALGRAREKQPVTWAPIYLDWDGEMRKGWELAKDTSAVVLVMPDGTVRWLSEGPLDAKASEALLRELAAIGLDVAQ